MKKIFFVIILLCFCFTLASCGKITKSIVSDIKDKVDENIDNNDKDEDIDDEDIDDYGDGYDYDSDDDSDYDYEDNTLDGSFEFEDNEGNKIVIGTEWPSNEYTKQLPEFNIGTITFSSFDNSGGGISASDVSEKDYKSYVKKLKDKGFTKNVEDVNAFGILSYSATNKSGYKVLITYLEDGIILTIDKN